MAIWSVKPVYKKSIIERQTWENGGDSFVYETGWRWGEFHVTTEDDNPPVLEEGVDLFNCDYEVELIVKIDRLGKNIEAEFADRYYSAIGLGIDFTARDVQEEMKKKSLPWEKAKAFDGSAVISKDFISLGELNDRTNIRFSLKKNGEIVQS